MELKRTESMFYNSEDEDSLLSDCVDWLDSAKIIEKNDWDSLMFSLEDENWIAPSQIVGLLMYYDKEYFTICKGENNNYFLVYI